MEVGSHLLPGGLCPPTPHPSNLPEGARVPGPSCRVLQKPNGPGAHALLGAPVAPELWWSDAQPQGAPAPYIHPQLDCMEHFACWPCPGAATQSWEHSREPRPKAGRGSGTWGHGGSGSTEPRPPLVPIGERGCRDVSRARAAARSPALHPPPPHCGGRAVNPVPPRAQPASAPRTRPTSARAPGSCHAVRRAASRHGEPCRAPASAEAAEGPDWPAGPGRAPRAQAGPGPRGGARRGAPGGGGSASPSLPPGRPRLSPDK